MSKTCKNCIHESVCDHDFISIHGCGEFEEQRPHGEWMPVGEHDDLGIYSWHKCSECEYRITWHFRNIYNFCPNCGADMRGGDGNEY